MRFQTFPLAGGLNLTTPVIALRPGFAFVAINYEMAQVAGYRRIRGYERFDGQDSPSAIEDLAAREAQRSLIQPVPGSGPVRGAFYLKGFVYAFRDTADGLAKKLYKATPAGWTEVTTPALLPGGKHETVIDNFAGNVSTESAYGVDGINPAFEFDGATYTPIVTGSEPLYPTHVAAYKEHLFLGYTPGSVVHSATGDPLDYTALNGAGEIAVGSSITGLLNLEGGVLAIFCENKIETLSGSSALNFSLSQFSSAGVKEWTAQPIFTQAIYLDRQIQMLSASDTFANFQAGTISEPVRPLVEQYLLRENFSMVSRNKNQYFLFDDQGSALVASFNQGQLSGFTSLSLPAAMFNGVATETPDGQEWLFLCGNDGYLYRYGVGTSFDGEAIQSFLLLAPNHQGVFEQRKRYRKVVVESDSSAQSTLLLLAEFNYGAEPKSLQTEFQTRLQGGVWNLSNYNEAFFSGDLKGYATAYIDGHGRNIAIFVYHTSATDQPFSLESMTVGFDFRGQVR